VPSNFHRPGKVYIGIQSSSDANASAGKTEIGVSTVAIDGWFSGDAGEDISSASPDFTEVQGRQDDCFMWSPVFTDSPYSTSAAGGSMESIAAGDRDAYIITTITDLAATGKKVFLRPFWEFNGSWGGIYAPWQYHAGDDSHQAENATAGWIAAWKRVYIMYRNPVRTRTAINAALTAAGLATLQDGGGGDLATIDCALVWCANHSPNPAASGGHATDNLPDAYWPGAAYMDWVAIDAYTLDTPDFATYQAITGGLNHIYDTFCVPYDLPLMFPELGTKGDDANGDTWHGALFDWVEDRLDLVGAMVWFNSSTDTNLLTSNPDTAAVWEARIDARPSVYVTDPAQVFTGTGASVASPSFVAAGTVAEAAVAGTLSPGAPTGAAAGDTLLLCANTTKFGGTTIDPKTYATPDGWTLLINQIGDDGTGSSSRRTRCYVWARVAQGNATDTPGLVWNNDNAGASDYLAQCVIVAYRPSPATHNPIHAVQGFDGNSPSVTAVVATGVTTTVADTTIVAIATASDDNLTSAQAMTSPASLNERVDAASATGADGDLMVADGTKATAGATGDLTFTYAAADPFATVVIALRSGNLPGELCSLGCG
jgi:hypothetical protein